MGLGDRLVTGRVCSFAYPITLGGDPAADSPTATLLRLNPPCKAQIRTPPKEALSFRPYSGGLTGGDRNEQRDYHPAASEERSAIYGFEFCETGEEAFL